MSNALHIFTPEKRRNFSFKLNEAPQKDSKSWTAARCHRLLRPITSRIEILRRDSVRFTPVGFPIGAQQTLTHSAVGADIKSRRPVKGSEDSNVDLGPARKRVFRTYSARCRLKHPGGGVLCGTLTASYGRLQSQKKGLVPGEILVPTPILNQSKTVVIEASQDSVPNPSAIEASKTKMSRRPQSRYVTKDGEAHFQLAETMRLISKTTDAARYKIYEGIYNALEALLRATMPHDQQRLLSVAEKSCNALSQASREQETPRSRSLLSMCLRVVPKQIKEEETRVAAQAEETGLKSAIETRVVSTETYSELEILGSSRRGWKHLRTVVRAHGVQVICDAIEEGFIDSQFSSALVMLCVHTSATDEAETILTSLLKTFRYPSPRSTHSCFRDDSTLLPLLTLDNFVKYTGHMSYYHRQLTKLFTCGLLSVTWLGTKDFGSVWTSVFRSLSNDPSDRDATIFMATVLPLICAAQAVSDDRGDDSTMNQLKMLSVLDATLASVLTTLSAISILSSINTRSVVHLLRSAILDCGILSSKEDSNKAVLVLMVNLLVVPGRDEDTDFTEQLIEVWRRISRRPSTRQWIKDSVPAFVCAVARCCGRGSSEDGFEHLKVILERLEAFIAMDIVDGESILSEVIVDSAFTFAQHLPEQKHHQYAQHIGTRLRGFNILPRASQSVCGEHSGTGFRWEEGINEWVTATPAVKPKSGRGIGNYSSDDESDCETPLRPSLKRRKNGVVFRSKARIPTYRYSSCSRVSDLVPQSPDVFGDDRKLSVQKDRQLYDEKFRSYCSPRVSRKTTPSIESRKRVTKLRRLGHELLISNRDWRILGDSDDELNLYTLSSLEPIENISIEPRNSLEFGRNQPQKVANTAMDRYSAECNTSVLGESEDELGL